MPANRRGRAACSPSWSGGVLSNVQATSRQHKEQRLHSKANHAQSKSHRATSRQRPASLSLHAWIGPPHSTYTYCNPICSTLCSHRHELHEKSRTQQHTHKFHGCVTRPFPEAEPLPWVGGSYPCACLTHSRLSCRFISNEPCHPIHDAQSLHGFPRQASNCG
jgi:hypothetical protein